VALCQDAVFSGKVFGRERKLLLVRELFLVGELAFEEFAFERNQSSANSFARARLEFFVVAR
jgi:hypothetical protein